MYLKLTKLLRKFEKIGKYYLLIKELCGMD